MAHDTSPKLVVDENELSQKTGQKIGVPIRLFDLQYFGVNPRSFIRDLAPTFSILAWDYYDVRREQIAFLNQKFLGQKDRLNEFFHNYYYDKATLQDVGDLIVKLSLGDRWLLERIRPRRKRSAAKFVQNLPNGHTVRVPVKNFSQTAGSEAGDYRTWPRIFNETSGLVTDNPEFRRLLQGIGELVSEIRPGVREISLTLHQVSIFTEHDLEGDNAPEGIHQDGSDYIVSALVVERDGILGGESIVYGPDKKTVYLRHTLQAGQGIFQADKGSPLWHDVTPINDDPNTLPTFGKRSIFGFDIDIIREK